MNRVTGEGGEWLRSALPVAATSTADDAAAYLYSVRAEAQTIADVLVSAAMRSEAQQPGRVALQARSTPTHWETETLRSFEELHGYVCSCEAFKEAGGTLPAPDAGTPHLRSIVLGSAAALRAPAARRRAIRRTTDVEDWPSSDDDDGSFGGDDACAVPHVASAITSAGDPGQCDGSVAHMPWLASVMSLDQQGVRSLLEEAVTAAATSCTERDGSSVPPKRERDSVVGLDLHRALWLYALLARLQKPLLAVEGAVMRQLYVLCKKQRAALLRAGVSARDGFDGDRPSALIAALETLLVITGTFFGQRLSYE